MDNPSCLVCIRQDPLAVLESTCLVNGAFKPGCLLGHKGFSPSLGEKLEYEIDRMTAGHPLISEPWHQLAGLVKGAGTASSAAGPQLQGLITDIEARVRKAKRLWQVIAVLGTVIGGAGGMWVQSERGPSKDPVSETSANSPLDARQKIQHQLELAQGCLDAGILDCADHLVNPIVNADSGNALAKKIKADLVLRESVKPQQTNAADEEHLKALIALAVADLNYARTCLAQKNPGCATGISNLILRNISSADPPVEQVRLDAESVLKQASAISSVTETEKTRRPTSPKVVIK